jgi:phosphate:Na+ symporter
MTKLVEDTIELTKLDNGGAEIKWEDCDLFRIAENAVDSLETAASAMNVMITVEGESAPMKAVSQMLYSVVYNLCDNAIKYNHNGGKVTVCVNQTHKRVTVVHRSLNIIGTVICLLVFYGLDALVHFTFLGKAINPVEIAFVHSVFNILTTIILLPFSKLLVKLAYKIIPEAKGNKNEDKTVWLDERLLASPPLATSQCRQKAKGMAKISKTAMQDAVGIMFQYDQKIADKVEEAEQKLDTMEDKLSTYLLKLSQKELTEEDSTTITELLHTIGDFERIGDHAINMVKISHQMHESGLQFSEEAKADFVTLFQALTEISELAVNAYAKNDVALANKVEPLEEVIDKLTAEIKHKHIERMKNGLCSPELGVYISDLLVFIERISDHYSNVAVIIIQTAQANVDKHDYLNELKSERNPQFVKNYEKYKQKYRLAE